MLRFTATLLASTMLVTAPAWAGDTQGQRAASGGIGRDGGGGGQSASWGRFGGYPHPGTWSYDPELRYLPSGRRQWRRRLEWT